MHREFLWSDGEQQVRRPDSLVFSQMSEQTYDTPCPRLRRGVGHEGMPPEAGPWDGRQAGQPPLRRFLCGSLSKGGPGGVHTRDPTGNTALGKGLGDHVWWPLHETVVGDVHGALQKRQLSASWCPTGTSSTAAGIIRDLCKSRMDPRSNADTQGLNLDRM